MITLTSTLSTPGLDRLRADLKPEAERITAKTALDIQADAQGRVPVDTGTARRSITARPTGPAAWLVAVGVSYGIYLEYGTSRMAARPYFTPAIEKHRPRYLAELRKLVRGG